MNNKLPDLSDRDKLYTISEAARVLGVHPSTLRLWENHGLVTPHRTPGGDRRYTLGDLQSLLSKKTDGRRKENGGGTPAGEKLYTVSEAARLLGTHPSTLRLWEDQGHIRALRTPGGDRRFKLEHLEALITAKPGQGSRAQRDGHRKQPSTLGPPKVPNLAFSKVPVRSAEHYRPAPRARRLAVRGIVFGLALVLVGFAWAGTPQLTKERIKRVFSPGPIQPIVDVNDALGYKIEDDSVVGLVVKFPLEAQRTAVDFLRVTGDALLKTSRFLGTVFFGESTDYFITPLGRASLKNIVAEGIESVSISSSTITVSQLNVEDLVVSGTSVGGAGGGGPAAGGDADTLEGEGGSYYLSWSSFTGTPVVLSSLEGVSNDGGNIDFIAGSNIIITPDDGANTITIASSAGSDADTLDGLDSLSFLRSDASDSFTSGTLTFNSSTVLTINAGATLDVSLGTLTLAANQIDESRVAGEIESVSAGSGLSGGGASGSVILSHSDTSSQASIDNSNGMVIQDIALDAFGHLTALGTADLDIRYYTETETDTLLGAQDALSEMGDATITLAESGDYLRFSGAAWADVTVSQILTDLLAVDGAGSGLDADLLDGQTGTYYTDLDNQAGTCTGCLSTTEIDESTFTGLNAANIDDVYLFNNGDTATGSYTFDDDVTLGLTSVDTLVINALVSSNIIPIDNTRDLGSAGTRWSNVFADEINATTIVGTISGGETTSSDWRINSDNATADLEDATITFDRGTVSPNGVLRWDSTLDRYRFESFPLYLDDQLVSGVTTGTAPFIIASTTLAANLNADLLDSLTSDDFLRSNASDSFTTGTLTFNAGTILDVSLATLTLAANQIAWDRVSKTGSSLADLLTRSAGDLSSGNLSIARLPTGGDWNLTTDLTIEASTFFAGATGGTYSGRVGIGTATPGVALDVAGGSIRTDSQLISTVVTGTAPLSIASTSLVTNLNVDSLDSLDSTQLLRSDASDNYTTGTLTLDVGATLDINGNMAWGGAAVTEGLNMANNVITNIGVAGTSFNSSGDLTLTGDLTVNGGELFLTPIASSGSTTEGTIYFDSTNSRLYVYQSGAFQELTTGLSKYSADDAALANENYIQIAHNQATNDLALTAWYYDSILSQWRTVENFTTIIKQALQNEFDDAPSGAKVRTETSLTAVQLQQAIDFGTGADGAIIVAANKNINTDDMIAGRSCPDGGDAVNYSITVLSASSATLSTIPNSGCLAVGDEVLLINLQGTATAFVNVGNHENLRIASISSNVVSFTSSKTKYYGDNASDDTNIGTAASNQRVMLQRVPNYTNVTVNSGFTLRSSTWNNVKGGVVFFRAAGTVSVAGQIGSSDGYAGGAGAPGPNMNNGYNGVGTNAQSVQGGAANTGGGGGGIYNVGKGGGGGSFGTSGTSSSSGTSAGNTYGVADLSKVFLGSGGGGGASYVDGSGSGNGGAGGTAGGIVTIEASNVTVTGSIRSNGGNGASGVTHGAGGGGASGGSIKLVGDTLNLGTNLVTATGGGGGTGYAGQNGGSGGAGRIALFYTTSLSATTNPTANTAQIGFYLYGLYHSKAIPTSNSIALDSLRWEASLPANTTVSLQTRTGDSADSTDGTWESWKPFTATTNYLLLESADTHTNWVGTNATVAEGDVTRNVDYFEDEDEPTVTNLTKVTSSTNGGYAEATISSTDILSYDYITLWVRASQAGTTLRFGFGEAAATEQTETIAIDVSNTWQKVYWDLSDVAGTARDAVTKLRITNLTTSSNTFYIDNIRAEKLMAVSAGTKITSTPQNYIQYRAILTTTNTNNIPRLENVSLVYNSGYRVQQPDNNTVRLYNFTGETQNVRLEAIVFGADLAEWYPVDDLSIEAGDVISILGENDGAGVPKVRKSSVISDRGTIGIISTKAGMELGIPRDDRRLVGLSGRVPVKIAPDSAPIQAGDLLTSSGTYPGMAAKAASPGFIVAKAFDNWLPDSGTDKISAFINISWADPSVLIDQDGDVAQIVDSEQPAVDGGQEETGETGEGNESSIGEEADSEPLTTNDEPSTDQPAPEEPVTQKILPKVEAEEGIFQTLRVKVEAVFLTLRVKVAEISSAVIENLTAVFIKADEIEAGKVSITGPQVGSIVVPKDEMSVLIEFPEISEEFKVFLTPQEPIYIGFEVVEGEGVKIVLAEPALKDIKVNYWILE
ncbi:MAG: hypothetical protein BMS9Abin34_125 [Patescibacteria group bacterium]|nr:MAG: hypothetical protein BMS9Abin34_125 [Patescibacteria group bacterium]